VDLEETNRLAHRRLQMKRFYVLPVFLEEGYEEVDTQHDVTQNLIIVHLDVPNSNAEAEDLLELEFDGGADFGEFVAEVFGVSDWGWEFAGF